MKTLEVMHAIVVAMAAGCGRAGCAQSDERSFVAAADSQDVAQ